MKKLPAIVLGLMLLLTGTTQRLMAQDEDISLQTFYDELSPYGDWIEDSNYGYVWRPDVDQNEFRPYYTNGRWAMTEYGNTWVSNYDWGWAPFHYGRWVTNRYNEWVWIPDTIWGPAWVNWRSGDGYYGWAPLGPSMGVNVNVGYGGGFSIPDFWWCFIPQRNIYYDNFPRYYSNRNYGYIHNTTIINNIYVNNRHSYYGGPRREDIRRDTRINVRVYNINRVSRPGRSGFTNNSVNLYRPTGGRGSSNNNGGKPAPRQVVSGSNYSARGNRTGDNNPASGRTQRDANNATRPGTVNPGGNRGQGTVRGDRTNPTVDRNPGTGATRESNSNVVGRTQRTPSDSQGQQQSERLGRQQRVQQMQQQTEQRQQADQQRQQQAQQGERQGRQQSEQQAQQRQQQSEQRQQANQQRQQQAQQQNEQRQQQAQQQRQQSEQRQQQAQQQNEQRQQQAQQQRQQSEQRQQQAQQQNEQRQQQAQQQRQQADQQRQQQTQPQRTEQAQPQRSAESRGGGRSGRN